MRRGPLLCSVSSRPASVVRLQISPKADINSCLAARINHHRLEHIVVCRPQQRAAAVPNIDDSGVVLRHGVLAFSSA